MNTSLYTHTRFVSNAHTNTHTNTCTYTHICTSYKHTNTHIHMNTLAHIYTYIYIHTFAGNDIYFFGIIDFLQEYDSKKRSETAIKRLFNRRKDISCVSVRVHMYGMVCARVCLRARSCMVCARVCLRARTCV